MAIPQKITDVLAKLDTETNEMAEYVLGLKEKITNAMTDEDVTSVHAALDAVAGRLDGIAKDPENPLPPVVPLPEV